MNLTDRAYREAIKVLESCAKPSGFYASGLPGGYEATWARDSMITSLGASLVGEKFKSVFGKSLKLLARHQSASGQIPNAVGSYNTERRSDITFNSIDSTLWYIIGHFAYHNSYKDSSLLRQYAKSINRAFRDTHIRNANIISLALLAISSGIGYYYLREVDYPLVVHFTEIGGIDFLGTKTDVWSILISSGAILIINTLLSAFFYDRVRFFSYLLSYFNLIFITLILISISVIISNN